MQNDGGQQDAHGHLQDGQAGVPEALAEAAANQQVKQAVNGKDHCEEGQVWCVGFKSGEFHTNEGAGPQ